MHILILLVASLCVCPACTGGSKKQQGSLVSRVLRAPLPPLPKGPKVCKADTKQRLKHGTLLTQRAKAAYERYTYDFSEGIPAYRKLLHAEICFQDFPSMRNRAQTLRQNLGRRMHKDLTTLRLSLRRSLNAENIPEARMTCRKILDLLGTMETPLSHAVRSLSNHLRNTESKGIEL